MKALYFTLFATTLGLSSLSHADFIGLKGDVSYWNIDGNANLDQKYLHEQDIDRDGTVQVSVAFEHPIPLLPNVKAKYTKLDVTTETNGFSTQKAAIDLDHTDLILYYEILDNIVRADVGVGATLLNGNLQQFNQTQNVDEYAPIIYAEVGGKLPFTGLSAKAEATYTDINDVKMTDVQAEIQYDFIKSLFLDVGGKVGYRVLNIELDDLNRKDVKMDFRGPYVGLNLHF